MRKNDYRSYCLAILLASLLLLAACGGEEPTPEPTAEPTAPAATAVPEEDSNPIDINEPKEEKPAEENTSAITLGEEVRVEEGGYSFQNAPNYQAELFASSANSCPPEADPDLGPQFFFTTDSLEEVGSINDLKENFVSEVIDGEGMTILTEEAISIAGNDGINILFTGDIEGQTLTGRAVFLEVGNRSFVMFGGAEESEWETSFEETFTAVLNSVTFFEPVVTAVAEPEVPEAMTPTPAAELGGSSNTPTGNTDPGIACFATLTEGLNCLTAAGEWLLLTTENSDLAGDIIDDMITCNDQIYMANNNGITTFDGNTFNNIEGDWGYSSPSGLACDANGGLWVTYFGGVGYYDGNTWTNYEASENLATGEEASDLVEDVVIDSDGTVWVVSSNAIASYDGANWTIYQNGQGLSERYFFNDIIIDNDGRPWAIASSEILQFDGTAWNVIDSEFFSMENAAITADNRILIGTFSDGIAVYDNGSWRSASLVDGISNATVRDVAVDNNGRVWAATRWGLSIFDGTTWQNYRMDTANLIDHDLHTIAVVNGGPTLPEPLSKKPGAITGNITEDDAPLANATVELCIETLGFSFSGETPCSDQQRFFTTTTNADGTFTFEEIPVGLYAIVVETSTGWAQLETDFGYSERIPINEGETTDVGQLFIENEE